MLDAGDVGGDLGIGKQLAGLVLAGRIADFGGAAADQHDWAVPRLLQLPQHHDADEVADMEARARCSRSRYSRSAPRHARACQPRLVGRLVDEAPSLELVQEVRFGGVHAGATRRDLAGVKPVSALPKPRKRR